MHKQMFITGGLYLFYLVSICFSYTYHKNLKELVLLVVYPIFELLLLYFFSKYCSNIENKFFRVGLILVNSLLYFIVLCQFIYCFFSGEYITLLALENINQAYVVLNWKHVIVLSFITLALGNFAKLMYEEYVLINKRHIALIIGILSLIVVIQNGVFIKDHKFSKYVYGTPLGSFFENVYHYYFDSNIYYENKDVTNIESYINKKTIFESVLPFQCSENFTSKPNVIILFAEGTSSRLLGCYGGKYDNLTSNIDDFSKYSMKVKNYYNHTAATFRGTHGQLASSFPNKGGYGNGQWADKSNSEEFMRRSYQTLPNILNKIGYDTYFLSPHKNDDPYTNLLKMLRFKEVYVAEDYNKLFNVSGEMYHDSIRDIDMYKSLRALMEGMSSRNPFLICMYTLNTHAFMDTYENGKKYKLENSVLNTLHNLDYCFGEFWNWFKESKYAKNTIVIFTTDHAHYYEKPYVELIKGEKDYKRYFIDTIPFIIYDPIHNLPKEYDAGGKTSLDFTPSLLHLLNVNNMSNSFLGSSIFDERNKHEVNIAALGNDFYYIMDNVVYRYKDMRKNGYMGGIIHNKVNLIKSYYILEERNDVFKD